MSQVIFTHFNDFFTTQIVFKLMFMCDDRSSCFEAIWPLLPLGFLWNKNMPVSFMEVEFCRPSTCYWIFFYFIKVLRISAIEAKKEPSCINILLKGQLACEAMWGEVRAANVLAGHLASAQSSLFCFVTSWGCYFYYKRAKRRIGERKREESTHRPTDRPTPLHPFFR